MLAMTLGVVAAKAQTAPVLDKMDTIVIQHSKVVAIQNFMQFSFKWLTTSKAPAVEVTETASTLGELYSALNNKLVVKDSVKVAPKKKP